MHPVERYFRQLFIACNQVINVLLLNGMADETISARSYRMMLQGKTRLPYLVINFIFFLEADHCKTAFDEEVYRKQYPEFYKDYKK